MFQKTALIFVLTGTVLVFAGKERQYVEEGTPLFRFPDCTSLKSKAQKDLDLKVLLNGEFCSKIKQDNGKTAYVKNEDLKRHIQLIGESVIGGYIPTQIILDEKDYELVHDPMLARHFQDEIFESMDREEIERQFDEN